MSLLNHVKEFVSTLNKIAPTDGVRLYTYMMNRVTNKHATTVRQQSEMCMNFCVNNQSAINSRDVNKFIEKNFAYSKKVKINVAEVLNTLNLEDSKKVWDALEKMCKDVLPVEKIDAFSREKMESQIEKLSHGPSSSSTLSMKELFSQKDDSGPDFSKLLNSVKAMMASADKTGEMSKMTDTMLAKLGVNGDSIDTNVINNMLGIDKSKDFDMKNIDVGSLLTKLMGDTVTDKDKNEIQTVMSSFADQTESGEDFNPMNMISGLIGKLDPSGESGLSDTIKKAMGKIEDGADISEIMSSIISGRGNSDEVSEHAPSFIDSFDITNMMGSMLGVSLVPAD